MKKLIFLMVIAIAVLDYGCRNADNYVLTDQLYGTGLHNFPAKVKGKVQEINQHSFWAKEENGKVVRGNINLLEDRYPRQMTNGAGYREQYNSSGTILKYESLNDKGETTSYWMVEAEGKIINKAIYYLRDTLIGYSKNTYTGNNLTEVKFFDSKNDTLFMSVVYNYDQDGNRIKFQTFNYKNEPGGYREFSYTAEGFLEHVRAYSETGEMTQLYDYTYNDQGDRIAEHNNENIAKGVTIDYTYKYEYDKKGNWVKCVFYIDNQPYMLREREIKYYN